MEILLRPKDAAKRLGISVRIVMHKNRNDVDIQKNIGLELNQVESRNDAKSNIDTFVYKR